MLHVSNDVNLLRPTKADRKEQLLSDLIVTHRVGTMAAACEVTAYLIVQYVIDTYAYDKLNSTNHSRLQESAHETARELVRHEHFKLASLAMLSAYIDVTLAKRLAI